MYKFLPFLISYVITFFTLIVLEKKFAIITKINSKIKRNNKHSFYAGSSLVLIVVVGLIGIYIIDFSDFLYGILCGAIIGIGLSFIISTKQFK